MPFLNPEARDKVQDALMSLDPIKAAIAMALVTNARDAIASPGLREAANDKYGADDIEIDDQPGTSRADDGTWVAAWVWIPDPEGDDDAADDDDDDSHCEIGVHSWSFETGKLPADTACTHCGELYGDPS